VRWYTKSPFGSIVTQ